MAERCSLSVVLPAFREARSLETLLPGLVAELTRCGTRFEILVVDTRAACDDTNDVCARYAVRHVRREAGDAYGDAVRTGIARARGTYILFMDADGSHAPESVVALWQKRRGHDLVIGSRYVRGGSSENGAVLVAMSRLLGFAFRRLFDVAVADATTSLRLYRGHVLRGLVLHANGFDILQEMLLKTLAAEPRPRLAEIPVTFARRTAGKSKRNLVSLGIAYVTTFFKLKLRLRQGFVNTTSP